MTILIILSEKPQTKIDFTSIENNINDVYVIEHKGMRFNPNDIDLSMQMEMMTSFF
jgi:hypothetical protein